MTRLVLCALAVLAGSNTHAQSQPLTVKELKDDLAVLARVLKEVHPGIYRYNTPAEFDGHLEALDRAWSRDMDRRQAFLPLAVFLAKIQCGHTFTNFLNQDEVLTKELVERDDKVPFYFRWVGNRMVVTRDVSREKEFPVGTEVLKINGIGAAEILDKLMRVSRSDGGNDAKRQANLEVTGGLYEAFDVFHPLYFPSRAEVWTFSTRMPGRSIKTVVARPVSMAARGVEAGEPTENPWTLSYPRPDTALLVMPTWVMYNSKWPWEDFLKRTFEGLSLKRVPNLVIDLRSNEGGSAVGDVLVRYLSGKPVRSPRILRRTRYQSVSAESRPFLSTWDKSFFDWGGQVTARSDGSFDLKREGDDSVKDAQPLSPTYKGRTFVLVGPTNSSATFLFANAIKTMKLGTLVGRPTGGNRRGINGGAFFFMTLPNSKFEVDVPLIGQFFEGDLPNEGVRPDVLVKTTPEDVARGRDVELETVFRLISKPRTDRFFADQY